MKTKKTIDSISTIVGWAFGIIVFVGVLIATYQFFTGTDSQDCTRSISASNCNE